MLQQVHVSVTNYCNVPPHRALKQIELLSGACARHCLFGFSVFLGVSHYLKIQCRSRRQGYGRSHYIRLKGIYLTRDFWFCFCVETTEQRKRAVQFTCRQWGENALYIDVRFDESVASPTCFAVERVVCLVCACWLANCGWSVKTRRHVDYS